MPAFVRGLLVCDGCGKTATAIAKTAVHGNDLRLWWELPEGWMLYAKSPVGIYCTRACNKHSAVMGYPDQIGRSGESSFDAQTIDKLYALVENAAQGTSADNVLSAIEAALIVWRQRREAVPS